MIWRRLRLCVDWIFVVYYYNWINRWLCLVEVYYFQVECRAFVRWLLTTKTVIADTQRRQVFVTLQERISSRSNLRPSKVLEFILKTKRSVTALCFFKLCVKSKIKVNFFDLWRFKRNKIWNIDVKFHSYIILQFIFFAEETIGTCILCFQKVIFTDFFLDKLWELMECKLLIFALLVKFVCVNRFNNLEMFMVKLCS